MSEEEKKELEEWKEEIYQQRKETGEHNYQWVEDEEILWVIGIIEKQQKEIEEYKELLDDRLWNEHISKETETIWKSKIKEKMQEIINYTYNSEEEKLRQDYAYDRLKELLGEEND